MKFLKKMREKWYYLFWVERLLVVITFINVIICIINIISLMI